MTTSLALHEHRPYRPEVTAAATRAAKAFWPSKLEQVCPARLLSIKPSFELAQIPRIFLHRPTYYMLGSPESSKYPPYRIEELEDLNGLPRFFSRHETTDYVEIWYCRTQVDKDVLSVAGRFIFTHEDSDRTQSVEQVWRCSPRLLEYYSEDFEYPYVRASRYSWNWPYSVEHVHIPKRFGILRSELMHDFSASMGMFERDREQVAIFLSFLDSFSFRAYSLEYKIVGSRLSIIDWDTPDDRQVVLSHYSDRH